MKRLHIDFEARSEIDIKKAGAWKYAMHPSTEVMCMAFAYEDDEGPPRIVLPKDFHVMGTIPFPKDIIIVAHNAHFEYAVWHFIMCKRFGWTQFQHPRHWDCTLARAAACRLPLSLENVGRALEIGQQKDLLGRAAMLKLCKPASVDALGDPIYQEDATLKDILYEYCKKDVVAEMAIDRLLPPLSPDERKVWELDLVMNRRGVQLDVPLAVSATEIAQTLTDDLNEELIRITGGAVTKASRIAEMKRFLVTKGWSGDTLDKAAVTELVANPDTPEIVKEVVKIRRQVGKSSTAKYKAIIESASESDGKVRGVLQYHAAGTGRWGGRLIQPQNFPQGLNAAEQWVAIKSMRDADALFFKLVYGDTSMETLSGALRGTITASPGHQLVVADYNAIEPRVLFWLAGEEAALNCYRRNESIYEETGEYIFKKKIGKHDPDTQMEYKVAKATVLGGGYGMGAPKFQATCKVMAGVDITLEMAEAVIKAYRAKFKKVRALWYQAEDAAKKAIVTPGSVHYCAGGKVAYAMDVKRGYLACRLPSGRFIRYFKPSVVSYEHPQWGEREEIRYQGPGLGGKLDEQKTYGGSLVENFTQAIARDVMAQGMLNCEGAGYPLVLTIHDELVADVLSITSDEGDLQNFIKHMCDMPKWADGLPLAAEGWVGERYRK